MIDASTEFGETSLYRLFVFLWPLHSGTIVFVYIKDAGLDLFGSPRLLSSLGLDGTSG
jgi:hypothetical protein